MANILDAFTKIGEQLVTTGGDYLSKKLESKAPATAVPAQNANPESNYNRPTAGVAPAGATVAPGMSQQTVLILAGAGVLGVVALVLLTRK